MKRGGRTDRRQPSGQLESEVSDWMRGDGDTRNSLACGGR